MEKDMNIDSAKIRRLREERAWSQDHLAAVAGLSLRTVQRVESDGAAAAETRMALAAALGLNPADLIPRPAEPASRHARGRLWGTVCGFGGAALGTLCAAAGVASASPGPAEAGAAYGLIGLFCGVSCAAVGLLSGYARR